jgi:glycosyltransferase involved in cell wall biosynthesis
LKKADGDFITFADSDDWVNPEKISNSIDFLLRENADLVVGRYVRMRFDGGIVWNGIRFARFALMGMTFRAAALKQVLGGFDSRSRHSADSEIFERARILLGERKVVRYPTIEIIALESGSNLTSEGGLAIDWVGTSGERVRYAESYRKWHGSIKNNLRNARRRAFGFRIEGEPLDDVEKMLEDRYDVVQENFTENNRSKDLRDDPILVTMCTYPGGFGTVAESLNHLLNNQTVPISKLILTVNGGELPEDLPDDTRLEVKLSKSDVTDKGKFIEIKNHEGYVITTDDDIQYPEDYVEKMVDYVDEFDREYLIGVHGAHLPEGPGVTRWWEYMNHRRSLVFPQEMPTFIPVNVIGTGTLAFHTSLGVPDPKKFDYQRMVDLHLAVWAQKNRIPMVICPRRRDWLKEIKATYVGRIWDTVKDDSRLQHQMLEVLQRAERWTIHARRDWGKFSNSGVYSKFGEWDSRELPAGMTLAKNTMEFSRLSDRPLVTIYMPAFNCEEYVIESINSALNQSYTNIEICIHDDGSTDRTLSLIKKKFRFNRRVRISSGNNGGIGHASNSAIRNGKGDLILQLDSDDILEPDAIEKLLPGMGRNIVCSYGSFIRIDEAGEKIDDGWDWPIYSHPRIMRSMIIHHPRLFRREGWEKIGGFDCDLENGVDYDFFLRLAEIGNFYHTSEKLYSYRIHGHSTSQEKYNLQTINTYLVQKRALERMNITEFTNFAPNPDFPRRIHYSFAAFRNRKGVSK